MTRPRSILLTMLTIAPVVLLAAQAPPPAAKPVPAAPAATSKPGAIAPAPAAEPTSRPAPDPKVVDFDAAVTDAKRLLDAGDAAGAAQRYEEALSARPDAAGARYNQGVALYRAGKFEDAAKAFAAAAESASKEGSTDAALAASSQYNRAASYYAGTREQAEAAQRMVESERAAQGTPKADVQSPTPPIDEKALEQAIKDARQSFQGFKDAATANPDDTASRANAEQSLRLVRALEELKKRQQQQQQQNKDDKKDQQQSKDQKSDDQQQKDDQQQQDEDQKQEQKQDQQKQSGDSKEKQDQKQDDQGKDKQDTPEQPKEQPKDQQQGQDKQEQQQPEDAQQQQGQPEGEPREMTKDEANRLLQSVRDRERQRRAMQEKRAEQKLPPRKPAKDW